MLRDSAVAEVQLILGRRSDLSAEIISALQFVQTEREKPGATFPWWLMKQDQAFNILSGVQETALPSDFIQEVEEKDGNLRYQASATSRTFFLRKMSFEQAEQHYFGVWQSDYDTNSITLIDQISPGTPKAYVLRQNTVRIYPTPDQNYTLTWSYWGKDSVLSSNIENGWLANAPWVLIAEAALKLNTSGIGGADAKTRATEILQRAQTDLFRSVIHRAQAGRSFQIGRRL